MVKPTWRLDKLLGGAQPQCRRRRPERSAFAQRPSPSNWDTEELIEHWSLLPQELELVENKIGFAIFCSTKCLLIAPCTKGDRVFKIR